MKIRTFLPFLLTAALTCGLFSLTSCENGNIFGGIHDRGDSGDPKALLNDADQAMRDGNFSQALSLYNRVLAVDSDNAQALYGSAAATMGDSGLNLGVLIANVMKQAPGSSSVNGLSDLIQEARVGTSAAATTDPDSLLSGINLDGINAVIDTVICRLQKIVSGASDGTISRDDTNVLVNLATICIIRAALRPIREGFVDITNAGGNYDVVDKTGNNLATFCGNNPTIVKDMAKDVAASYALFNRAVNVLGLSNDRLIAKLRSDVENAMLIILGSQGALNLPAACTNLITNSPPTGVGIDLTNFRNYSDIFNPPSGC